MSIEIKMPQLGESVHEGTIGKWLKQEGEHIEKYEPLLEVITDKVDTEITAAETGTLLKILAQEGETVSVGTVIALVGEAGAAVPDAAPATPAASDAALAEPAPAAAAPTPPRASPVAARMAAENGVDLATIAGSGRGGQIVKADVERAIAGGAAAPAAPAAAPIAAPAPAGGARDLGFISPRVARIAASHGVDLRLVPGTGKDGRITARDVEAFIESPAAAPTPAPRQPAPVVDGGPTLGELVKMTPMRTAIAEHMVRSKHTSPHVSTVHEVDMGAVTAAYRKMKAPFAKRGVKLTYTAFIMQAVAEALAAHPLVNSSWTDDGIQIHNEINIGMAVAVPTGLIVPVIRRANELSLEGLAKAVTDLAIRARDKQLVPDDVQGGTFTVTNYGTLGSLFGTPVISQPQAAILGTGAIKKRVVVVSGPDGDQIAIRPMMFLALTFDHRILDGGTGDPFVQTMVRKLEGYRAPE